MKRRSAPETRGCEPRSRVSYEPERGSRGAGAWLTLERQLDDFLSESPERGDVAVILGCSASPERAC